MIEIYPDAIYMIEVFLIGLVVALIGAGGFVFFISSMHADRNARCREMAYKNPWERLNLNNDNEPSRKPTLSKGVLIWLIALLISILALTIFLLTT